MLTSLERRVVIFFKDHVGKKSLVWNIIFLGCIIFTFTKISDSARSLMGGSLSVLLTIEFPDT